MRLGDREALGLSGDALVHPRDRDGLGRRAVAAQLGRLIVKIREVVVDRRPLTAAFEVHGKTHMKTRPSRLLLDP